MTGPLTFLVPGGLRILCKGVLLSFEVSLMSVERRQLVCMLQCVQQTNVSICVNATAMRARHRRHDAAQPS